MHSKIMHTCISCPTYMQKYRLWRFVLWLFVRQGKKYRLWLSVLWLFVLGVLWLFVLWLSVRLPIFTPNALERTLLSNDVKLHMNDWTFLKLSAVEREIDIIFCEISSLMTENIKFTPPHQSLYAMPNHLPIICQNLIIWKLLLSEQLEFWKARSMKNGYGSPREKKWMDIWYSEYRIAERGVGT